MMTNRNIIIILLVVLAVLVSGCNLDNPLLDNDTPIPAPTAPAPAEATPIYTETPNPEPTIEPIPIPEVEPTPTCEPGAVDGTPMPPPANLTCKDGVWVLQISTPEPGQ